MRFLSILLLAVLPIFVRAQSVPSPSAYQTSWNRADSLAAEGLPKSALAIADQLYNQAKATKNYPQVAKAAMNRVAYRHVMDEADYMSQIISLKKDIADTPDPARAVLQSVLADVYWRYYQQNRYKFQQRTTVNLPVANTSADKNSPDNPATWDARRLFTEVTAAYLASLRNVAVLRQTPLAAYASMLDEGNPDTRPLRPTLFDLLAHRAIGYFQNTEPDIIRPASRFVLNRAEYLAGPETFARAVLTSRDSLSGRFQALKLYQQLVAHHLTDANPLALADVDNLRLSFVLGNSVLPNRDSLYRQTLRQQMSRYTETPLAAAEYQYQLSKHLARPEALRPAGRVQPFTDYRQAAELARDLIRRFPDALVGRNAGLLLQQLTTAVLTPGLEKVTVPDKPFRALVTYRNVATAFYRLYKVPINFRTDPISDGEGPWQHTAYQTLLAYPLAAEGQTVLPDDGDLRTHSVEIALQGLPAGHYVFLMSPDKQFVQKTEQLTLTPFAVSQLSYLIHSADDTGRQTLYVTDRETGQPLAGIPIALATTPRQSSSVSPVLLPLGKTDVNGQITAQSSVLPANGSYWFRLTRGPDVLDTDQAYNYQPSGAPQPAAVPETLARFFTDRAIYRPGQPIYVKGLLYRGRDNSFNVVPNQKTEVTLNDVNGEIVSRQALTTNAFGTFTGTFTAPVSRLTGAMTIACAFGQTDIRVEEYKRPTFAVTIDSLKASVRLEQTVTLTAVAKTLSGAVVDGAPVRYRVTRSYYPPYLDYGRKQAFQYSSAAEVASGDATTDATGTVRVTFPATADPALPAADNPRFTFAITIDVTDRAGETRSATQTLRIGYSALQAELTIPGRVSRGSATTYAVRVTNQAGKVVPVRDGQVVISRLETPGRVIRKRLWERPDRHLISREEFGRLFPNDLYDNEDDPTTWPKQPVTTTGLRAISVATLAPGTYVAEATVTESTGEKVSQQRLFTVVDEPVPEPTGPGTLNSWVVTQKNVAEPGETATFLVGADQTDTRRPMWVLLSVAENHTLVRQEWLHITDKPLLVQVPVSERQRGGFTVGFTLVQNGRLYTETRTVTVPFTSKQLTVNTHTFRDKLKPGQPEEWTLTVSGPAQDNVLAEMVATLYDASLDQFVTHSWPTDFYGTSSGDEYGYASGGHFRQSGCFGLSNTRQFYYRYRPDDASEKRRYDQLMDWTHAGTALQITVTRSGNTIRGRVTNATGQGSYELTVSLSGAQKGISTDKDGRFSLTATTPNPVRLQFSLIGYVTQEIDLDQGQRFLRMPAAGGLSDPNIAVAFSSAVTKNGWGRTGGSNKMAQRKEGPPPVEELREAVAGELIAPASPDELIRNNDRSAQPPAPAIRRNLNETAFFFPQLQTDAQGRVMLKFTMPEALTRWRLLAFAHTKDLKTGTLTREVVTQKELMITANTPRFLREGDTLTLSARVNNLTGQPLTGSATLTLLNALTGEPVTGFGRISPITLTVTAGLSTAVSWSLTIPVNAPEAVTVRLTAQAGSFSDGEEQTVPVLPNRTLVTDTQPFWVNGTGATTTVRLLPLTTLSPEWPVQHERLTVEVTSNPVWYTLQSLPYLMEYRYEGAEQLFSRLYANSLSAHILNSRPAFRQVVDAWQRSAPKSPLQTNEALKAISLENTPWLADGRSESERTARLGQLFDRNQLAGAQQQALDKLAQLQTESGGFQWFGGMRPDLTMTLHILSGFGHLQRLGVKWADPGQAKQVQTMTDRAIQYVDTELKAWVAEQKKLKVTAPVAYLPIQYLYARSFYPGKPIDKATLTYASTQMATRWLKSSLQEQAMAALALSRLGNKTAPAAILKSLRERATTSAELGMYWPENQPGLFWYQSPVETQAYLIEAFDEIANDTKRVDQARQWLLRQKQTRSWSSTKATTEAVYALLLRGSNWLSTAPGATVLVGGQSIQSRVSKTDVATGYQKVVYAAAEIKPELGVIQVSSGKSPAWGAAYWQRFEPLDRVKPSVQATGAGLSVQKILFVKTNSPDGPVITPITAQTRLTPGDLVTVRVLLTTDRDMEYVHLKDSRASGFEPVTALSGYKYQNGLGYYEAPRDAGTDFFLGMLPVGTHVFEYDLRVAQTGDFSAGVATVQCFYAPEFEAHSAGGRIKVQ